MQFDVILEGARAGDAASIDELHRRFAPAVLARIRKRLSPRLRRWYDTADIGQSVFLEVLRDLPRFENRGERAFHHWLYLKAENKLRMKLRKEVGRGRRGVRVALDGVPVPPVPDDGPVTAASNKEERARLQRALHALAPGQRKLLQLRARDGLSYADMARRLALPSTDAARVRYARALLALRKRWQTI